jgi:basic amino acid/polyamine antiporter, APA family
MKEAQAPSGGSGLKRTLGLPSLFLYGLGAILGAGIYSVLGAAAGRAGEGVWLSFLLSALLALVTSLAYAELSTAYPRAGAEYVYLRRALPAHRWAAFAAAVMMAASSAATAATVSLAFAGYLGGFIQLPQIAVAAALLAALTAVAIWGIRQSAWMSALFTLIEAGGLVLFIVVGARTEGFGEALAAQPSWGLFGGASLVFFSFLGFENIANLAEEAKKPERDLPRAILLSLGAATVLYVLVALAAVALIDPAELAESDAPLAAAVAKASPRLVGALGGVALFATTNTALSSIISGSRLLYGVSRGGDLPQRVGAVLGKRRTPWVATLIVAAVAGALVPLGKVAVVASVSSFAALLAFASVNVAVIALRYREPDRERPFRVPLTVGRFPLLPAFGAVSSLALLTQLERDALIGGAVLLAVTLGAHFALNRRGRSERSLEPAPSH